ncbi:MAG: carboxypeptidase-like regulatory domain-containing protein, partial [Bacteroidota bacterium]
PNVDVTLPVSGINYGNDQKDTPSTPPVQPTPDPAANLTKFAPWIGLGLLLLGFAAALIFECPGRGQFMAIRILLALGAAGIATILPGLLNFKALGETVTAGGAIGLGVLIYLFNPAQGIVDSNACNPEFDFTIRVEPDASLTIPAQYPAFEDAQLALFLNNKWEDVPVQNNGLASFRGIPSSFSDQEVEVRLDAKYWKLENSSVLLSPDGNTKLPVVPDNSLGVIIGKVMDANTGNPIGDVRIGVFDISATSNASGNFTLTIPLASQREIYEVYVFKEGYESKKASAAPATAEPIKILLNTAN